MKDSEKTKKQLINELSELRQQVIELKKLEIKHKEVEETLRESEKKYRELVQNTNSIVLRIDTNGRITFFNKFAQKFFGYTEDEILGKNLVGTIVPEIDSSHRDLRTMIKNIIKNPERYVVNENENIRRNGERVWILWTNKGVFDKEGQISEIVCIGNDITERKQAEEKLKVEKKFSNRLFESSGVCLLLINSKKEIVRVNDAALKVFGRKREEVLGRICHEFICPAEKGKCPVFDLGQEVDHSERIALNSEGEKVPIIKTVSKIEKEGETYLLENFIDISGRKQVEEKLRFERAQLLSIFDSINEIIYVTDPKTYEILYANRALKDAFKKDPVGGICYKEFQGFDSPCEFCTNEIILKEKGKAYQWEYHNPVLDRDYFIVDRIIKWLDGRYVRFEFARDITKWKQVEEELAKIVYSSSIPAFVINREHKITHWNTAVEFLTGLRKEEVIGTDKQWVAFYAEKRPIMADLIVDEAPESEFKEKYGDKYKKSPLIEGAYECSDFFPALGEGGKWLLFTAAPLRDKEGKVIGALETLQDITEQKQVEEDLRKSQQEFLCLFRSSPEALVYLDEKGNILDINSRFTELFGYTLEEVKGRNIDNGMIHPPNKIEEGKKLTKKSIIGYVNYETIRKKKDGTLFPVSVSGSNIIVNGQLKGIIASYIDITERQRMMEKIKKSEERFRDLFENANDAIWTADIEGRYLSVNQLFEKLLGYTKEELIGKKSIYLVAPESRKESIENYKKTLNGESTEYEVVVLNKKGERRIHRERLRLLKEKGEIIGVQGIGRDITANKQNEKLQGVLYNISKAANSPMSLNQLYKTIHKELSAIIDTANFYIALVDEKEDKIFFPYHQDEKDNNFPVLNLSSNTTTTYVIKTGQPFLINRKQLNGMIAQGALTPWGTVTDKSVWLGVPLKVEDKVIGAMVVQSYTNPELYSEKDIKLLEFVSSQVATAIKRKQTEERIKYLSFHDALTGLYNRAYFEEELKRLNNPRYYPLSIISIDVNGLKVVNDTFGHDQGDKLLQHVASLLTSISRKGDIIARVGGDEFAILLPSTPSQATLDFCERIRKACLENDIEPIYLRVNLSLGYVTQEGGYKDISTLLKDADKKMYQDKLFSVKSREKHLLDLFGIILAERDPHTEDHAQRLQELALSLGKKVGLTEYQLGNLKLLALLHDIGKIGIPDSILFKTYVLTPSEWKKMKEHPEIGSRIAKNIPDFAPVAREILYHHEHWDGSGYPKGLKGEEIPLLSRIISIVDAYDVMISRRPYKGKLSKAKALEEIKKGTGSQFDPQLAKIFLKMVKNKKVD